MACRESHRWIRMCDICPNRLVKSVLDETKWSTLAKVGGSDDFMQMMESCIDETFQGGHCHCSPRL